MTKKHRHNPIKMQTSPNLKDIKAALEKILKDFPVHLAYLYGSFAEGTHAEDSDIDIALVLHEQSDKNKILKTELRIATRLDEEFGADFDVRSIDNAPLKVKGEVITQGTLVYSADEEFRVEFETYVRDRYFDYLPTLRRMRELYFTSVKEGGLLGST